MKERTPRALATVASIEKPVIDNPYQPEDTQTCPQCGKTGFAIDEFLSPHNGRCSACQGIMGKIEELKQQEETPLPETEEQEAIETDDEAEEPVLAQSEQPRKRGRGPNKPKVEQLPTNTFMGADEDFFDYIARAITPQDWQSPQMSGLYGYKIQSGGNLGVFKGIRKALTQDDIEEYAIKHGPGNYKVQLSHRLLHLQRPCGTVVSFDGDSLPANAGRKRGANGDDFLGASSMVQAMGNIAMKTAETGINAVKGQMERNQPLDMGALFQGMAAMVAATQPKAQEDKTGELMLLMLQNQAAEAVRRADTAEKRAEDQRRSDREEADRREQRAKVDADAARERDQKFFDMMLQQANGKADSLNQFTGLLSNFLKVKNEIDDTMGGGPKGPWDLVGNALDGVIQHGPAIVAAMKGATPAQVQQMQQQANPEAQPPVSTPQMQFRELVGRIGTYCRSDSEKWNPAYLGEMIQEEYGGIAVELFENEPKEKIVEAFQVTPPGDIILAHPAGQEFIGKLIDWFKTEEPPEEDDPEPIVLHGKARKVNGKVKSA